MAGESIVEVLSQSIELLGEVEGDEGDSAMVCELDCVGHRDVVERRL